MKRKKAPNRDTLITRYGLSILSFLIIIIGLNVLQTFVIDDVYAYATKRRMKDGARQIEQLDLNSKDFMARIAEIEVALDVYVEIYSPRDNLIYSTGVNETVFGSMGGKVTQDKENPRPRIMRILQHNDVSENSYFEVREEYFATAKYIVYGTFYGNNSGMELYSEIGSIKDNARTASITIIVGSAIISLLIICIFLIYTYTFTIPLRKINRITKQIEKMNFDDVCPPFRIKELEELSESVNALSASLNNSMQSLKQKNIELEHELEQKLQLEENRKQFIANTSHELKTPIAIIQGYAEGIKICDSLEDAFEYGDIIVDEAQKMNNLVVRMLETMRLENKGYEVSPSKFNLKNKIDSVLSSRSKMLDDNSITLRVNVGEESTAFCDEMLFELVFNNYISNAISHVDGEKIIEVSCRQVDNFYRISIINSGKPIDDGDIEKIWNSFYRADKAHSRQQGRFGLGLSIVANAQALQNADYGVINHDDSVEFWFDALSD